MEGRARRRGRVPRREWTKGGRRTWSRWNCAARALRRARRPGNAGDSRSSASTGMLNLEGGGGLRRGGYARRVSLQPPQGVPRREWRLGRSLPVRREGVVEAPVQLQAVRPLREAEDDDPEPDRLPGVVLELDAGLAQQHARVRREALEVRGVGGVSTRCRGLVSLV